MSGWLHFFLQVTAVIDTHWIEINPPCFEFNCVEWTHRLSGISHRRRFGFNVVPNFCGCGWTGHKNVLVSHTDVMSSALWGRRRRASTMRSDWRCPDAVNDWWSLTGSSLEGIMEYLGQMHLFQMFLSTANATASAPAITFIEIFRAYM